MTDQDMKALNAAKDTKSLYTGTEKRQHLMGSPNEHFYIDKVVEDMIVVDEVRSRQVQFNLKAGPAGWNGNSLGERLHMIEIESEDSQKEHRQGLPFEGFGSMLSHGYSEAQINIAEQYCRENDFSIQKCYSTWPTYQAFITKNGMDPDV